MAEPIEHVSDTAFWVAYYRGQESLRTDALFRDPLAAKLAGKQGETIARHMGIRGAMQWSLSVRTWIIDGYIAEAVADGIDMIINLGAGLDTRPYRLDLPSNLQWVEIDFLHIIDYKNKTLADDTAACQLERIACDLSDAFNRQEVLSRLNGRAHRILVLTEGVIPYLSNDAVSDLARDLETQNHISYWLTDYFSPFFLRLSAKGGIRRRLETNAPFLFSPGPESIDWSRFFAEKGWEISEMRYIGEEGRKIGRDLPANWLTRFLIRFVSEGRLRPYRRMNGYALLKRGNNIVAP